MFLHRCRMPDRILEAGTTHNTSITINPRPTKAPGLKVMGLGRARTSKHSSSLLCFIITQAIRNIETILGTCNYNKVRTAIKIIYQHHRHPRIHNSSVNTWDTTPHPIAITSSVSRKFGAWRLSREDSGRTNHRLHIG